MSERVKVLGVGLLAALSALETVAGASVALVVFGELVSLWDWL